MEALLTLFGRQRFSGIQMIQVANLADSLAAIKTLVYEQKRVSLPELTEILRNNWKDQELLRRIVVVGAYLKRRNNLILVNEQEGTVKEEELDLSIKEIMKNLQLAGINCAGSVNLGRALPADVAMALLDFYEYVVENAFDGLRLLLARFFCRDGLFFACIDAVCTKDLTALSSEQILVNKPDEDSYTLSLKLEGGDGK